jgi:hypothetical protein
LFRPKSSSLPPVMRILDLRKTSTRRIPIAGRKITCLLQYLFALLSTTFNIYNNLPNIARLQDGAERLLLLRLVGTQEKVVEVNSCIGFIVIPLERIHSAQNNYPHAARKVLGRVGLVNLQ